MMFVLLELGFKTAQFITSALYLQIILPTLSVIIEVGGKKPHITSLSFSNYLTISWR
jgi:hypothetical protein